MKRKEGQKHNNRLSYAVLGLP